MSSRSLEELVRQANADTPLPLPTWAQQRSRTPGCRIRTSPARRRAAADLPEPA